MAWQGPQPDPRWKQFGFHEPLNNPTPEPIADVFSKMVTGENCVWSDEFDRARGKELAQEMGVDFPELTTDMLAVSFQVNPELITLGENETPHLARRHAFLTTLMDTATWKTLHEQTKSNMPAAKAAAEELVKQYIELAKEDIARKQHMMDMTPKKMEARKALGEIALGAAVMEALEKAEQAVDLNDSIGRAMGVGGENSGPSLPLEELSKLFNKAKRNPMIRRICELAGRYRLSAQAKQRSKTTHGMDDMVGVELSGEVGRILPQELALLKCEQTKHDAIRRLAERQMMSREYRGVEKLGKGPIVVCVDESGSMEGEPIANAKAFALAMYWIARQQKRWCILMGYSGSEQGSWFLCPHNDPDPNGLMQWLEHFFGRGTELDQICVTLPQRWKEFGCPKGKTDIIIITDGECGLTDTMRASFLAWKKAEDVRVISMLLGCDPGVMKDISDEVFPIQGQTINLNEDGVQAAFSI